MNENASHEFFAGWLDFHFGETWCHPPNGGRRDLRTARMLQRMGVKAGVPDFLIFLPPPGFAGFALELKREKGGRTRPEQKKWLAILKACGWRTDVAHGHQEAVAITENVYGGREGIAKQRRRWGL